MKLLGQYLVEHHYIDQEKLTEAIEAQTFTRMKVGRICRALKFISQKELNQALSRYFYSKWELREIQMAHQKASVAKIPLSIQQWAENHKLVLFDYQDKQATALAPYCQDEVLEEFEKQFDSDLKIHVVDQDCYQYLLKQIAHTALSKTGVDSKYEAKRAQIETLNSTSDPYTLVFLDILKSAFSQGASDIHIQPMREGVQVRFRILGDMLVFKNIESEHRYGFLQRVKQLSSLNIAVSGRPQDSRFSFESLNIDVRVSLLPSQFGENIVLRLLDQNKKFSLDSMGYEPETLSELKSVLKSETGLFLISGPTGSGKSTTLIASLYSLDRKILNIITLEDPIEYTIHGVTQVQMTKKLSFSDALRSVLRQDPDVILVGEIRDEETAKLCLKASATGHLVLSTVHANGAIEVIDRLIGLNIDLDTLQSNLKFSAAQRLVQILCPACKILIEPKEVRVLLEKHVCDQGSSESLQLFKRNRDGCSQCHFGLCGRKPVLEYLNEEQIEMYFRSLKMHGRTLSQVEQELKLKSLQEMTRIWMMKGDVDAYEVLNS